MLKKKNKLCVQIMLFWLCKTQTSTLNGIVSWIRRQIFLEKSDENKAGQCWFLAWFDELKVCFCEIITDTEKICVNGAWTEFIALGFALGHKQSFMHSIPLMNS